MAAEQTLAHIEALKAELIEALKASKQERAKQVIRDLATVVSKGYKVYLPEQATIAARNITTFAQGLGINLCQKMA